MFELLLTSMILLIMKIILMELTKVLYSHRVKAQLKKELNLLMKKGEIKKSLNMEEGN